MKTKSKKAWPVNFAAWDKEIEICAPIRVLVDYDDVDHAKARKMASLIAAAQVMQNALVDAEACLKEEIEGGAGKRAREDAMAAVQDALAISRRRIAP